MDQISSNFSKLAIAKFCLPTLQLRKFVSRRISANDAVFWDRLIQIFFSSFITLLSPIQYLLHRYHLIIFQHLPHQMAACLSGKQHFFIKKFFWQINFRSKSSDRKMPITDFQSQFSTSKIIRIFLNFFFIEEYQFRGMFFVNDIF